MAISNQSNTLSRNLFFNLMGILFPLVLAVIATPFLIKGLGIEKFGLLTIIWLILGYFSFLDFGVSRALTNVIAKSRGQSHIEEAWSVIYSSLLIFTIILIPISLCIYTCRHLIINGLHNIPLYLFEDVLKSFTLISLSLPVVVITGILKGALEGFERFDITNAIRLPMALWSYTGPLLILPFSHTLFSIVVFLLVGRLIAMLLFGNKLFQLKGKNTPLLFSFDAFKKLIRFGGWIGVSTVLSPLLIFVDRFIVASKLSVSIIAYYTTPMDALSKLLQPIDAISNVFFPALSKSAVHDTTEFYRLYTLATKFIGLIMLAASAALILFSFEILNIWISESFAIQSYKVMGILALGLYANAIARAPYIGLQALGKAKMTAQLQLLEFLPYSVILIYYASKYQVVGVAVIWATRVIVDALLLFILMRRRDELYQFIKQMLVLGLVFLITDFVELMFIKLIIMLIVLIGITKSFMSEFKISNLTDIKRKLTKT